MTTRYETKGADAHLWPWEALEQEEEEQQEEEEEEQQEEELE